MMDKQKELKNTGTRGYKRLLLRKLVQAGRASDLFICEKMAAAMSTALTAAFFRSYRRRTLN
jgi:hypothetical protein